jgi:hypothetical protein
MFGSFRKCAEILAAATSAVNCGHHVILLYQLLRANFMLMLCSIRPLKQGL